MSIIMLAWVKKDIKVSTQRIQCPNSIIGLLKESKRLKDISEEGITLYS